MALCTNTIKMSGRPGDPIYVASSPIPESDASLPAPSDGSSYDDWLDNNLVVDPDENFKNSFTDGSVNTARKRALDVDYVKYLGPEELRELQEALKEDYYLVPGGSDDTNCYLSEEQWQKFCKVESNRAEDRKELLNPFTRQAVKPEKFSADGERISVGVIPTADKPEVGQFGTRPSDNLRPRIVQRTTQPICVCVTDVCC